MCERAPQPAALTTAVEARSHRGDTRRATAPGAATPAAALRRWPAPHPHPGYGRPGSDPHRSRATKAPPRGNAGPDSGGSESGPDPFEARPPWAEPGIVTAETPAHVCGRDLDAPPAQSDRAPTLTARRPSGMRRATTLTADRPSCGATTTYHRRDHPQSRSRRFEWSRCR